MTVPTDVAEKPDVVDGAKIDGNDQPAVRCTGLSHRFEGNADTWYLWGNASTEESVTALNEVTLAVEYGEIVGVAGPSGSGKSTLLHLLAGLAQPTEGEIEVANHTLTSVSSKKRTAIRHRHVGFVFQRFHLLPSLSARANVALPLVRSGVPTQKRRKRASALLERVGLGDRVTHLPSQLSGGEKQRVAIARALVTEPDVILADEPTGELDRDTGLEVLDILSTVTADQAVIIASHDQAVHDVTDRVIHLQDGETVSNEV